MARKTEGSRLVASLTKGRPRVQANLATVAALRGQTEEESAEQLLLNLLRSVPKKIQGYKVDFDEIDVAESGVDAGTPWLRTTGGRTFYDHPATAMDALMYVWLRDLVPDNLSIETLVVAANAIRRYVHGAVRVPENARVVVDAGCYIGYKAIAYADRVGPDGKVVAIEMMPDNYDLLRRNVEANDLTDRVTTVHCGLSDRTGTVTARRSRKQQATIADVDQLAGFGADCEVPMDTLANVFDRTISGERVDFLNVQVNGHELAVLEGLGPWLDRVDEFYVASPYSQDGQRVRDQVVDWFRDHRIEITEVGEAFVTAKNGN
jgi:FkbM family methyltransferase